MVTTSEPTSSGQVPLLRRALRVLRPSHQHSAFSATLLLMSAVMVSRVIGYIREAYIAWAFGAGPLTDAYVAAFTLPDFLNYILAGGTASITFIAIYSRYLAEKREADADKTFSVIVTVMVALFVIGTAIIEVFATPLVRHIFHGFGPDEVRLCVQLTRIVLPTQLFFYVGGVYSAVLLARRMFLIPALGPLLYNIFIIGGGLLLSHKIGVASLAVGALAGAVVGPFLVNAIGATRSGIRYFPNFDFRDSGFREWLWLSVPLMLGVSLVTADDWILRYFASSGAGDISRLNYAKRLFAVPMAVLGQAAGQASLPFFARLFSENRRAEFARAVSDSVYRIVAASLLASAWMMSTALPIIDLVYRRGNFKFTDSRETAAFFFWFSLSLAFWAAQSIYSRAFYGAGNTITPMIASTIVTICSIAVYRALFHALSVVGLAIASDVGIIGNTVVLAVLLHQRGLVAAGLLRWKEIGKSLLTATFAGLLSYRVALLVPLDGHRANDVKSALLASVTWAAAVALGLWITKSDLPHDLRRRKAPPTAPATSN